ncbi:nucleoside recognition protein [candidate division LCP-89 bacterium B3_LCP]|uniref:Nucleoside recognition protein n=1 Tax=candidate division LCP-89 bacterium B3_LCP TaxID=2012998 RepID=A0A532UYH2_UNCL8|nr:MAG: nucleoside recognition protein [candidate division LCP-89 bacterium B3_LCP]
MLNYIWSFLILGGVFVAAINGRMSECTQAVMDAAKGSVELAIGLIGIMAFWLGLMRLAEEAGLVRYLSRLLKPVLKPLFPDIPADDPALGNIVANLAANMLGLGNSATALGLKAMIELQRLNPDKKTASNAMCTFLAINTSSVTIIPATVIAIRASAGSANPAEVIGVIILTTAVSTVVAITAVKLLERLTIFRVKPEGEQNG